MRSFSSLPEQVKTLCRKAKSDLFFDAPTWAIVTTIGLFPSGVVVALLYGSAPNDQDPDIFGQLIAGCMIAIGVMFAALILRQHVLTECGPRRNYELFHFGKSLGKLSGTEVSDIALERLRNSDTWYYHFAFALQRLPSCCMKIARFTAIICILITVYAYLSHELDAEQLLSVDTLKRILGLSFNLSVWIAFTWLAAVLMSDCTGRDEGLHQDMLKALGHGGTDPREITFSIKITRKLKTPKLDQPA